jgi:hypothetical protein
LALSILLRLPCSRWSSRLNSSNVSTSWLLSELRLGASGASGEPELEVVCESASALLLAWERDFWMGGGVEVGFRFLENISAVDEADSCIDADSCADVVGYVALKKGRGVV